jgi:hypothetical protein
MTRYCQRPAVAVAPRVPVMVSSARLLTPAIWRVTPAVNRTKFGHIAAPALRGGSS